MASPHTILSWTQFQADAGILGEKLKAMPPFKGVVAVARGGLIPAAMIAHILDLRLIDSISVSSYDAAVQREGEVEISGLSPAFSNGGEGWLVIDDLVDSGKTYRALRKHFPKACFAAIYAKPAGKSAADIVAKDEPQDRWIIFPWERDVSPSIDAPQA